MTNTTNGKGATIWNRNYVLCMLVSACASFAQSMFNPAMPVYGQSIGLGADVIGFITAIALLLCMFGRGISGKFSDIMSKKKLVWIGMTITISGYVLYFFALSMPVFFVARVLQTIGSGMTTTVLSALSISVVPSKRIPSAIAIFSIASSLAQCFAPNIGTNLAYGGQFKILFVTAPLLLLLATFLLSRINEGPVPGRPKAAKAPSDPGAKDVSAAVPSGENAGRRSFLDKILCVPAIPSAILLLFNGIIFTSITNYLSLYGLERDLKDIGIFFTVNAVTMIVSRPLVGKICDSKPLSFIIIPGFIAEMAACALLALTWEMPMVYGAAVCYGLGFGSTQAAIQIMAIRSVGPERRGDANGTFYVGGDIGLAFGAYAAGAIFNAVGSKVMYLFMAAVAVVSVVFYLGYQIKVRHRNVKAERNVKSEGNCESA